MTVMWRLQWNYDAWEDYCYWQRTDKAALKRINLLIRDILRNPFDGIGKPEPLKGNLSGENRFIYVVEDSAIVIISCKGHYE